MNYPKQKSKPSLQSAKKLKLVKNRISINLPPFFTIRPLCALAKRSESPDGCQFVSSKAHIQFFFCFFFFSVFLATWLALQDLSSPTRDWTQALVRVLTTGPSGSSPKWFSLNHIIPLLPNCQAVFLYLCKYRDTYLSNSLSYIRHFLNEPGGQNTLPLGVLMIVLLLLLCHRI